MHVAPTGAETLIALNYKHAAPMALGFHTIHLSPITNHFFWFSPAPAGADFLLCLKPVVCTTG